MKYENLEQALAAMQADAQAANARMIKDGCGGGGVPVDIIPKVLEILGDAQKPTSKVASEAGVTSSTASRWLGVAKKAGAVKARKAEGVFQYRRHPNYRPDAPKAGMSEIIDALTKEPGLTRSQICKATGIGQSKAHLLLQSGRSLGLIDAVKGSGNVYNYTVTEAEA